MNRDDKIFVAGHRGLAGSAILRRLQSAGFSKTLLRSRADLDLTDRQSVDRFFAEAQPDYVFLAAAKVGGILANSTYPADFIRDNLLIQTHVIDAAYRFGSKKLLFLGSSCIYPRQAPQPMKEDHLLTGKLEPTNDAYAIAKIAGILMCQAYQRQHGFKAISLMPTNLYGPGDNFDLKTSHALPAIMRKCHEAKQSQSGVVEIWGSGKPRREFLHVDDLADACLFLMDHYDKPELVNVGSGIDETIENIARITMEIVGFRGELRFDTNKPDGTPRKLLDVSKINGLGWKASIGIREGIERTYKWYVKNHPFS